MILKKNKKYLQISLNSNLYEAEKIIRELPISGELLIKAGTPLIKTKAISEQLLIEAGTPLIKTYGIKAITEIKNFVFPFKSYIVADIKCDDLARKEVRIVAAAGASAATCLGVAPIETIDSFIEECREFKIDSIIDMINVENPLLVLRKLKTPPNVVMLHRGVDELEFNKEKRIPFYQIQQIKGNYDVLISVAGGETLDEVEQAFFNDADIVVVWKSFYNSSSQTAQLAREFFQKLKIR